MQYLSQNCIKILLIVYLFFTKILNKNISKLNPKYIKRITDDNKIQDPSNLILLP